MHEAGWNELGKSPEMNGKGYNSVENPVRTLEVGKNKVYEKDICFCDGWTDE